MAAQPTDLCTVPICGHQHQQHWWDAIHPRQTRLIAPLQPRLTAGLCTLCACTGYQAASYTTVASAEDSLESAS